MMKLKRFMKSWYKLLQFLTSGKHCTLYLVLWCASQSGCPIFKNFGIFWNCFKFKILSNLGFLTGICIWLNNTAIVSKYSKVGREDQQLAAFRSRWSLISYDRLRLLAGSPWFILISSTCRWALSFLRQYKKYLRWEIKKLPYTKSHIVWCSKPYKIN